MNPPKKILVVDDEESIRLLIRRLLEAVPAVVTLADGPEEADRLLAAGAYDLVLLDLLMPVEGGIQLLTRMRAMPAHRSTPVIVVSVMDDMDTRHVCQSLGVRDYVVKPIQRDALINTVKAQLA
jgi:CheY-like chemotaxis protein